MNEPKVMQLLTPVIATEWVVEEGMPEEAMWIGPVCVDTLIWHCSWEWEQMHCVS